jgi:hypothetical protein
MSLVIAYVTAKEAILGGDRRSITFGDGSAELEEELYCGSIVKDEELLERAEALDVWLQISDGRDKVWKKGDVLVGEVSEISLESDRRRRIYATSGGYFLVDISDGEVVVRNKAKSAIIVLGNKFTKALAEKKIRNLKVDQEAIRKVLAEAGSRTASVSSEHTVIHSSAHNADPEGIIIKALHQDCEDKGWKLCGLE